MCLCEYYTKYTIANVLSLGCAEVTQKSYIRWSTWHFVYFLNLQFKAELIFTIKHKQPLRLRNKKKHSETSTPRSSPAAFLELMPVHLNNNASLLCRWRQQCRAIQVSSPRDVRHAVSIADIFDLAFLKSGSFVKIFQLISVPVHVRSI
jgi:hypothetical protein